MASSTPVASVEVLLAQLRAEAEIRGPQWLQSQVAVLMGDGSAGAASPSPLACQPWRTWPLEHLSPEATPWVQRCLRSPSRDPPLLPSAHLHLPPVLVRLGWMTAALPGVPEETGTAGPRSLQRAGLSPITGSLVLAPPPLLVLKMVASSPGSLCLGETVLRPIPRRMLLKTCLTLLPCLRDVWLLE